MELSNLTLFKGISQLDCDRMVKCMNPVEKSFKAGDIICDFGVQKKTVGIVKNGRASIVRYDSNGNKTVLESLTDNSLFGDSLAFSCSGGDCVLAICEKSCTVVFIEFDQIAKRCSNACHCHSVLTENLFMLMSQKARLLSERIEIISQRTIRDKLMCYLYITALKQSTDTVAIITSLSGLSEYICSNRSAMVREIGNMKDEGLIEMNGKKIRLKNYKVNK